MQSPKLQSSAQGTIEYLVILAVVVVIGLVLVGISSNFLDDQSTIQSGTQNLVNNTSSTITVKEAVVDTEGTILLSLQNNTGEERTLNKITIGEEETIYNTKILPGTNPLISLTSSTCFCSGTETTKTCSYDIYSTSKYGLEQKEIIQITLDCVENATSEQPTINEKYYLEITSAGNGTVTQSGNYLNGQTVSLTATPENGWIFVNWTSSNGGTFANSNLASTTFTMPNNSTTITANFSETIENQYFIFLIRTTSPNQTFRFQTDDAIDLNINWGDGTIEIVNGTEIRSHEYEAAGDYNILLRGTASRIAFGPAYLNLTPELLINTHSLIQNGIIGLTNMSYMFYGATNFNSDLSNWDVSNITNMSQMFANATNFNNNLSNWNTSNVEDMHFMFLGASSFNQDLNGWDTSNVTNMQRMFGAATNFNSNISTWNTSNVIDMRYMFMDAINFNKNISDWNTSNVTHFDYMFQNAINFNQNLSNWNVSNVIYYYNFDYNTPNWILPKPNFAP